MKKIISTLLLILTIITITGCSITQDNMKNINIYTTTYPLKYLINYLYGENSKIYSIYPVGVDINEYSLSDRKLEEYSKSDLFIFNSQDKDRDYAVKMINLNSDLKVIDSALGMSYDYSVEELWLNPYNYLMMAENIKIGLTEYISNHYIIEEIENNYKQLEYDISKLDSDLTQTINESTYKTIVTDNDVFKFLEKYGLKVISLEENDNLSENKINEARKLISEGKIKYIYTSTKETNNTTKNIITETNIEQIQLNTMHSIDGEITNTNDNYLTVMTNNINLIKKELYK